ncbi:S8 family serine peptidase [Pedobacter sp. PLR]|uniref:S8 family serine peptidase n=1 Tax=Pedobacter sp. PLR TaxID=2994465 RepID=UPI002245042D|nr:S8 family serine peptidase [Pedobacter sp. PLR]MCX2452199.1 S8 family serine peptidase [Pedobacter sp. PLR]
MKKVTVVFSGILCVVAFHVNGQLVKPSPKQKILDWQFSAFDQDGVYGAEVNKAYEFLKGKQPKKKPIIAMVGYGLDIQHEDLKNQLWINPADKADGIDNDKNGLVDDVNGWNFLGNANGDVLNKTNKVADREFMRLKGQYLGIWFNGKDYVRFDVVKDQPVVVPKPANLTEFQYFRKQVLPASSIGAAFMQADLYRFMKYYLFHDFNTAMMEKYPDLTKVDGTAFAKIAHNYKADSLKYYSAQFLALGMTFKMPTAGVKPPLMSFAKYKDFFMIKYPQYALKYEAELRKVTDNRSVVGDDPNNINQKNYGNNDVFSNSAFYGTTAAGVIAAQRNNDLGINGIVDAQLMPLKVYPKDGEPFYKDIALAIRYAADHKADVIVLGMPNAICPPEEAKWMSDALVYAEKKGVLVIAPVWDMSEDLGKKAYYPNRHVGSAKDLGNFMSVAASDEKGNPVKATNYSKTELDLYAPGVNISTTYLGSTYRISNGSLAALSVAAGIAGLIKSYYPNLTGTQLRTLMLNNVTSRAGVEVEKTIKAGRGLVTDLYLLKDLSISGGIVNAYQAVKAADTLSK